MDQNKIGRLSLAPYKGNFLLIIEDTPPPQKQGIALGLESIYSKQATRADSGIDRPGLKSNSSAVYLP